MPRRQEADAAGAAAPTASFSTPDHPSFSSFAHIPNVEDIAFSIGLRESGDIEKLVHHIIPMAKISPGEPVVRKIRAVSVDMSDEAMASPECQAALLRLKELTDSNAQLKGQLEELTTTLSITHSKISASEKMSAMVEEANDRLSEQLDELRSRAAVLEHDAEAGNRVIRDLEAQVATIEKECDTLEAQVVERLELKDQAERLAVVNIVWAKKPGAMAPLAATARLPPGHGAALRRTGPRPRTTGGTGRTGRVGQVRTLRALSPGNKLGSPGEMQ